MLPPFGAGDYFQEGELDKNWAPEPAAPKWKGALDKSLVTEGPAPNWRGAPDKSQAPGGSRDKSLGTPKKPALLEASAPRWASNEHVHM